MGWFSRTSGTAEVPGQQQDPPVPPAAPTAEAAAPAQGRYGPRVRITAFEQAPDELTWQLPVRGELYRLMPGADRPDYSLMLLEKPLLFYPPSGFDLGRVPPDSLIEDRKGRRMVQVHALILCARFVGQQLHPGMVDLPVNIAYVIDLSLARDDSVDFAKIEYAAIGFLTEGADAPAEQPASPQPTAGQTAEDVGREVARLLRQGIADRRGAPVERLSATITIDGARRISGLTGNADGTAPEPTTETFDRINAALARLAGLPPLSSLTLQVAGDEISVESTPGA